MQAALTFPQHLQDYGRIVQTPRASPGRIRRRNPDGSCHGYATDVRPGTDGHGSGILNFLCSTLLSIFCMAKRRMKQHGVYEHGDCYQIPAFDFLPKSYSTHNNKPSLPPRSSFLVGTNELVFCFIDATDLDSTLITITYNKHPNLLHFDTMCA